MAQLTELTAASTDKLDTFLGAVASALGGQPFTFTGLNITRKKGDTLLSGDAVATVNGLISAVGSGIVGSGAQARGGACVVCVCA